MINYMYVNNDENMIVIDICCDVNTIKCVWVHRSTNCFVFSSINVINVLIVDQSNNL